MQRNAAGWRSETGESSEMKQHWQSAVAAIASHVLTVAATRIRRTACSVVVGSAQSGSASAAVRRCNAVLKHTTARRCSCLQHGTGVVVRESAGFLVCPQVSPAQEQRPRDDNRRGGGKVRSRGACPHRMGRQKPSVFPPARARDDCA
jgi:hypothetical protein